MTIAGGERSLAQTGLRGRQLAAVVGLLGGLGLLALLSLAANLLIVLYLGMGPRGIGSLQMLRDSEGVPVVRFLAKDIALGTVVANSGQVGGHKDSPLEARASRILLGRREAAHVVVEAGRIRAEGVQDLLVVEPATRRPLFSARHPTFALRNGTIKRIAAKQVITNLVKAPVDRDLKLEVDNISFRGNEGNDFKAKTIRISADKDLTLRTSEKGSLRLNGHKGIWLSEARQFPLSSSPRLSASVLGHRLCLCADSDRLFAVPGNKPCTLDAPFCP